MHCGGCNGQGTRLHSQLQLTRARYAGAKHVGAMVAALRHDCNRLQNNASERTRRLRLFLMFPLKTYRVSRRTRLTCRVRADAARLGYQTRVWHCVWRRTASGETRQLCRRSASRLASHGISQTRRDAQPVLVPHTRASGRVCTASAPRIAPNAQRLNASDTASH